MSEQALELAETVASVLLGKIQEMTAKRFFSVAEAEIFSGLSSDSIRNLLAAGKLKALRPVPGRVLVDRRELESYILGSTRAPVSGRGRRRGAAKSA